MDFYFFISHGKVF